MHQSAATIEGAAGAGIAVGGEGHVSSQQQGMQVLLPVRACN
jgi:hypothetical protein